MQGRWIEQTAEIGAGSAADLCQILPSQMGDFLADVGNVSRLVAFATIRHRGQVRCVGFNQEPVKRAFLGNFLDLCGVLESDDAGKRQVKPEVFHVCC